MLTGHEPTTGYLGGANARAKRNNQHKWYNLFHDYYFFDDYPLFGINFYEPNEHLCEAGSNLIYLKRLLPASQRRED